jgi:alkylation response protein AidB-like acyl-CoA dehydrogenase
MGFDLKEFGGPGLTGMEGGVLTYELAKADTSIGTFVLVQNSIGIAVVDLLGSDEQRKNILPDAVALKKILAFGLTEPDYGSDASSLKTSAKKVEGGYVINGKKRWIGNGTMADVIIVWAVNESEGNKI